MGILKGLFSCRKRSALFTQQPPRRRPLKRIMSNTQCPPFFFRPPPGLHWPDDYNPQNQDWRRSNPTSPEEISYPTYDTFSDPMEDFDGGQEPDHLRAKDAMNGLGRVPRDLLSRYKAAKGEDRPEETLCTICIDQLDLDPPSFDTKECNRPEPGIQTENMEPSPTREVVVCPQCLHLFHSECLLRWLAHHTTCPTCRKGVEGANSSASHGGTTKLEAWVRVEEEKSRDVEERKSGDVKERSLLDAFSGSDIVSSDQDTEFFYSDDDSDTESYHTCHDFEEECGISEES